MSNKDLLDLQHETAPIMDFVKHNLSNPADVQVKENLDKLDAVLALFFNPEDSILDSNKVSISAGPNPTGKMTFSVADIPSMTSADICVLGPKKLIQQVKYLNSNASLRIGLGHKFLLTGSSGYIEEIHFTEDKASIIYDVLGGTVEANNSGDSYHGPLKRGQKSMLIDQIQEATGKAAFLADLCR